MDRASTQNEGQWLPGPDRLPSRLAEKTCRLRGCCRLGQLGQRGRSSVAVAAWPGQRGWGSVAGAVVPGIRAPPLVELAPAALQSSAQQGPQVEGTAGSSKSLIRISERAGSGLLARTSESRAEGTSKAKQNPPNPMHDSWRGPRAAACAPE